MEQRSVWVVAYDVVDDRRRERIARILLDFGVRVQYSVFECALTRPRRRELMKLLQGRMDPVEDSISFYLLCHRCEGRIRRLGREPPDADPQYVML